eukprot:1085235-Prorocentrum_minimum.AAC.1
MSWRCRVVAGEAQRAAGLTGQQLGMLTSSIRCMAGDERLEIGLNLKHGAKNLCIPDYTRVAPPDANRFNNGNNGRPMWEYSDRAIQLLKEYTAAFPWIAPGLEQHGRARIKYNVITKNES